MKSGPKAMGNRARELQTGRRVSQDLGKDSVVFLPSSPPLLRSSSTESSCKEVCWGIEQTQYLDRCAAFDWGRQCLVHG